MATINFNPSHDEAVASEQTTEGSYGWREVWIILTDYLQPNTTLSLDDAVDQVSQFWATESHYRIAVVYVPICLARQIPYDHPSHLKLSEFMVTLYDSRKYLTKLIPEEQEAAEVRFRDHYGRYVLDEFYTPDLSGVDEDDPEDPIGYANYCAFLANLVFPSDRTIKFHDTFAVAALNSVKKVNPTVSQEVRDAWVIGGAQFIIYQARAIFDEVLKHRQREADYTEVEQRKGCFSRWICRKRKSKHDMEATFTWDDWQAWRIAFGAAAVDEMYSKTCRDIAQKAADLMRLQQKAVDACSTEI